MADSTSTSAAAQVLAENLATTTADYVYPRTKIAPLCNTQFPERSKVVKFPKNAKDSAAARAEDGGSLTAAAWTPTSTSVTAAQVGVLRTPTQLLEHLDPSILDKFAQDAARLLVIKLETDLALLFASATRSISNTTLAFSVAHYLAMQANLENNDTVGPYCFVLWNKHFGDLKSSIATSTAAIFGNAAANVQSVFERQQQGPSGTDGQLFGSRIKRTSTNTTANGGVDAVSAVMVDAEAGAEQYQQAAIGIAVVNGIEIMYQPVAAKLNFDVSWHWSLGAGLINTDSICKGINAI